jgi:hypothetical protein
MSLAFHDDPAKAFQLLKNRLNLSLDLCLFAHPMIPTPYFVK